MSRSLPLSFKFLSIFGGLVRLVVIVVGLARLDVLVVGLARLAFTVVVALVRLVVTFLVLFGQEALFHSRMVSGKLWMSVLEDGRPWRTLFHTPPVGFA